ncbi:MAG: mannose-1-phosphate guanylyltransferase [Thermoguttaceae bacterium]|nr:mannose-1-phosphate guanylyltransferase [Thermoguttaceae bacterium]MDW8079462.1 mannose-1-phosphate guanylyltransferase [Thermoguttaceae bacterium]
MLYGVIMAGGVGTRFWPESRGHRPKQLLPLVDSRTMLEGAVDRLRPLVPPERLLIATTERLAPQIRQILPQLDPQAIFIEPVKRDTAPCIGLAAVYLLQSDPEAVMVVTPSDHVIEPEEEFLRAIRVGVRLVEENPAALVTFGIKPSYPAQTFGYIERGEPLHRDFLEGLLCYHARQFCEKPPREMAEAYLQAGTFYWNSGIFIWRADTILKALAEYAPDVYEPLLAIKEAFGEPNFDHILRERFAAIRPISIDYAVMQHYPHTLVIEAPFCWDDLGNWRALERVISQDPSGNTLMAARHLLIDARGNIVRSTDPHHLIVLVGVDDLVVVTTPDATLVARKDDEENLRRVVPLLADLGWTEYL